MGWVYDHIQNPARQKTYKRDRVIWGVVFALSLISIVVVYSPSATWPIVNLLRGSFCSSIRAIFGSIGFGRYVVAHKIDYRYYSGRSRLALWISVPCCSTHLNMEPSSNGARVISIPVKHSSHPTLPVGISIINFASMFLKKQQNIDDIKDALIPCCWCGILWIDCAGKFSTAVFFATCMLGHVHLVAWQVKFGNARVDRITRGCGSCSLIVGELLEEPLRNEFIGWQRTAYQAQQDAIAVASGGITSGKWPLAIVCNAIFCPTCLADFVYPL